MENKSSSRRKRSTAPERQQTLETFRQSGLSHEQFAEENGIRLSTLKTWIRKSQCVQRKASFIAAPNIFAGSAPFRFEFPSGPALEVRSGFQAQELASILKLIQSV